MATSKERDKEHPKGHLAMKTPPIVSPQEWEAARQQLLVKEKALTRSRDALAAERRRMPWMAVEKEYEFDGTQGQGQPARPVRGPPSVDRLSRLLRARRVRLARARLPRLLPRGRSGRPPRPSERPRHHARLRLARAAGGHRAPEGADGLGDALVHHHRQLRRRLRRGRVARPQRVLPRRRARCSAPTSSTAAATRRWGPPGATSTSRRSAARRRGRTRQRVTPRPRRTSGGTGTTTTTPRPRLTRSGSRCPTLEKPPSESATQRRNRAKEGRPLRRPRAAGSFHTGAARLRPKRSPRVRRTTTITASDEQGISVFCKDETGEVFHTYSCHGRGIDMVNGAYQFLDLVSKGRERTASNSRWSGYAGTISIEAQP